MNKKQKDFLWDLILQGWILTLVILVMGYTVLLVFGSLFLGLIIYGEMLISELGIFEKSGLVTLGLTVLYWIIRFIKYSAPVTNKYRLPGFFLLPKKSCRI